ncbi:hypothetical protein BGX26_007021 [Mortierella sp. AD094]|nr:hypothetical protein BGX26_007021 [Mortierella sp. AD094]
MNSVGTSGSNGGIQYEALQNIDHTDEATETTARSETSPCSTAQRRFFDYSGDSDVIPRAGSATFTGKESTGHYIVRWRVKVTKDFSIPNGLHFAVNVLYDTEPDITGSLNVILLPHKLNVLVKERWYDLVLEEKSTIPPHVGKARVQLVLQNNENIDRVDYSGFTVDHVEIRPVALPVEGQASVVLNMGVELDPSSDPGTTSDIITLQEAQLEHELLYTFIGFGEFLPETRKSDWEMNNMPGSENNTFFVTCNGLHLDVFEISSEKKWMHMHTITLSGLLPTLSRWITCKLMMESITSNMLMWLEGGGHSCTIWNPLTGSNINHISGIENASFEGTIFCGHSRMAISPHESIVALASVDGSLTTYFANTGIAISSRKFPGYKIEYVGFHDQDDQLLVILRDSTTFESSATILDTLQLMSEVTINQIPIPTIGSTILAFFCIKGFWGRGMICEADATRINFYESYRPKSSKVNKNSLTVIKAETEKVVYESRIDVNIQYRLKPGIRRELLPKGDGVSHWILHVEVAEENLALRTQRRANHAFAEGLLNTANGDWIPRDNRPLNPIKHAIEARNGRLVEVFIEYCIKNAKKFHPSYLVPVVRCLNELSDRYPTMLTGIFKKASYVQSRNSSIAISSNIHGSIKPLKPVFSLQSQLPLQALNTCDISRIKISVQGRRDDKFPSGTQATHSPRPYDLQSHDPTFRFFVASFDLIWSYKVRHSPRSFAPHNSISWTRTLIYLIMYKFILKGEAVVKCHDFTLEMLDSPAISALIEYKWNTIGRKYWMTRFFFQCCYYLLVLSVILLQVYGNYNKAMYHVFIVDLAAFGLPLVGSTNQLFIHSNKLSGDTPQDGYALLFSFSVLFMALQFLFELRVNSNVCQFATIIISIFGKIRMFFFIMAGSIIAFSIAILHMLRSCQFETCVTPTTDFQSHFYKAVSSTIFIIFTRSHTLIGVSFFILLLNVLIALINVAFNDSDITWRLAWLENRMRFLESAENLSYHIPDLRKSCGLFPNEIYYSASEREVEQYEARYHIASKSSLSLENKFMVETLTDGQNNTQVTQRAVLRDVQELSKEIDKIKNSQEKLTELLSAFLAQTTTANIHASSTESLGSVQRAEPLPTEQHSPPVSPTTPTTSESEESSLQ